MSLLCIGVSVIVYPLVISVLPFSPSRYQPVHLDIRISLGHFECRLFIFVKFTASCKWDNSVVQGFSVCNFRMVRGMIEVLPNVEWIPINKSLDVSMISCNQHIQKLGTVVFYLPVVAFGLCVQKIFPVICCRGL